MKPIVLLLQTSIGTLHGYSSLILHAVHCADCLDK